MYLSHVRIKNFRNFGAFEIEFRQGLNVIVGENNIGKTNLFDAIRIALGPGASTGRNRIYASKTDLHRDVEGQVAGSFEVRLTFSDIVLDEMSGFLECLAYDKNNLANSKLIINYRWSWNEAMQRYSQEWWGGETKNDSGLAVEAMQNIPATYLEPLRDAQAYLTGGRHSRIGTLLRQLSNPQEQKELEDLFKDRNEQLAQHPLVKKALDAIQNNLRYATSDSLAQTIGLVPAQAEFDAIANSLRMILRIKQSSNPNLFTETEISENGLGYNNLLYIATVLAELERVKAGETPLLIVEEPEAHLHPQLQSLLADFLLKQSQLAKKKSPDLELDSSPNEQLIPPQIFITTHSPTLAAHFPPDYLSVLHHPLSSPKNLKAAAIWNCGLDQDELRKLQRLLDVTKATLFFARGVILVEGICEQLLLPVFAQRLEMPLADEAITVIPIHGVNFQTLLKIFDGKGLEIPCSILTDADPAKEDCVSLIPDEDAEYLKRKPRLGDVSAQTQNLSDSVSSSKLIKLFYSRVTLEYDLAWTSGAANVVSMMEIGNSLLPQKFQSVISGYLADLTTPEDKACLVWQLLCERDNGKSKAPFAHELALALAGQHSKLAGFQVPDYICNAIQFVHTNVVR